MVDVGKKCPSPSSELGGHVSVGDGVSTQMWASMGCACRPGPPPHLCQCGVQLEYLALALHLPHADLAGELGGGQAVPLQGEGAVEGPLAATPYVTEGDLLGKEGGGQGDKPSLPCLRE